MNHVIILQLSICLKLDFYQKKYMYSIFNTQAQGYLARNFFKYVYLSFFIITKLFLKSESLLLFKLD